jgi:hypothetical protein
LRSRWNLGVSYVHGFDNESRVGRQDERTGKTGEKHGGEEIGERDGISGLTLELEQQT